MCKTVKSKLGFKSYQRLYIEHAYYTNKIFSNGAKYFCGASDTKHD